MNTASNHKNPPLSKFEWGCIVGLIAILVAWIFISSYLNAEKYRKDRILKEDEEAIIDCIKAKRWAAPNQKELCQKADEKHTVAKKEFGVPR